MLILVFFLLMAAPVHAASLVWDETADGFLQLEYSTSPNGPFAPVATIPAYPPRYPMIPGKYGYYRLTVPQGPSSQVVRFFADVDTGWIDVVSALETRVKALETPPEPAPVSSIIVKSFTDKSVEIACASGVRPSQKLSSDGLKRIVECP